jgi:hypothetical protein
VIISPVKTEKLKDAPKEKEKAVGPAPAPTPKPTIQ